MARKLPDCDAGALGAPEVTIMQRSAGLIVPVVGQDLKIPQNGPNRQFYPSIRPRSIAGEG
jgi:hypothetical protein